MGAFKKESEGRSALARFSPQCWLTSLAGWRRFRNLEDRVLRALPASEKICLPIQELHRRLNEGGTNPVSEKELLAVLGLLQQQGRVEVISTQDHGLVVSRTPNVGARQRANVTRKRGDRHE